jgi:hypothetical protein
MELEIVFVRVGITRSGKIIPYNIKSAFDLRDLGHSLVAVEFADF